jgi:hypothetical protein
VSLLLALVAVSVFAGAATANAVPLGWFGPILPESTGGSGEHALAVACPSTIQCTAVENQGQQVTFDPVAPGDAGLTPTTIDPGNALLGLACPSASQCTAVENEGHQITFDPAAPTDPTRTQASVDTIGAVACPSLRQCIGVGNPTSNVVVFDPPAAEHPRVLGFDPRNGLDAVACPSSTQCTAIDLLGGQVTFDPTAPVSPVPTAIETGAWTLGLACPSVTQCTAVDNTGRAVTFDPMAPGSAIATEIAEGSWLWGIACPSRTQCTAVGSMGSVTFNPTEPGGKPLSTRLEFGSWERAVACPSTSQCTVVGADEEVTFNPTEAPVPTEATSPPGGGVPSPAPQCSPSIRPCTTVDGSGGLTLGSGPTRPGPVCIAPGRQLGVTLNAVPVERSHGAKVRFAGATFRIDGLAVHAYRATGPSEVGSKATAVVTTVSASAGKATVPPNVELLANRVRPGLHTLTMKLHYREIRTTRGHRHTSRITRTLTTKFRIC